jgi:hypothetical protein
MDDTTLAKLRGDVINRTVNIETIMSLIITQHYFGRILKSFFVDVLYNEGFSWRLKCSILIEHSLKDWTIFCSVNDIIS